MALKDLLIYLDPANRSPAAVRLAVDLAHRHGSSLTALYVRGWSPEQLAHLRTAELAGQSFGALGAFSQGVERAIDRGVLETQTAVESLAAQQRIALEWRVIDGEPRTVLPQHARYADLCILGADTPAASTAGGYRFSEEMLFVAGRPVLLVPNDASGQTLGAHIAVAWNSSRSAARALNDAMPLLELSESTTLITVNPGDSIEARGGLPVQRLLEHLRRHGVSAHLTELSDVPADAVAAALQEKARAAGADLLVAGAHGHTWLREVLLGSVTRDLLAHLALPVMMSH